jgi:hypothetical protein
MSKQQYNLNTKTDYLSRKMFLDPAGPVTIQRFEEVKYKKIADYDSTARGFFWQPEEISLSKDANDFKDASDAVKHIFTSNLLRQTALDSLQGRGPTQVFTPVCSLPEVEALSVDPLNEQPVAVPFATEEIESAPSPLPPVTEFTDNEVCENGNVLLVALNTGEEIAL